MNAREPESDLTEPVLIAHSKEMRKVIRLAERAAASDLTVLIQGETGTGKELIARIIHRESPRREGPFVAANCGAYTDSLLASELFGHVRGAFTGAVSDRSGVFQTAAGGTVFLDEIGSMSPEMQVKLLRVLQERKVVPVGSSTEIPVEARVVAATNSDLAGLVRARKFREDLYYRVKVVSCSIPPLRERRDDIPALVDHYLGYFCRQTGKHDVRLSPATERLLLGCDWPGNVRQLRSELERIVSLADDGAAIEPDELSDEVRSPVPLRQADDVSEGTYQELLDAWTREVLIERLTRFEGNISKTAESLAISRSTLYALLKKYGLHGT